MLCWKCVTIVCNQRIQNGIYELKDGYELLMNLWIKEIGLKAVCLVLIVCFRTDFYDLLDPSSTERVGFPPGVAKKIVLSVNSNDVEPQKVYFS